MTTSKHDLEEECTVLKLQKLKLTILLTFCIGFLAGCGGSGGSDGPGATNTPAQVDIAGIWQVEETVNGNCGSTDYPYSGTLAYTVTQQNSSVTIRNNLEGTVMQGTLSGYTLTFNGTTPDGDGSITISFTGQCSQDGLSFQGTGQWTYAEPGYTCNGTTQITGTKPSSSQVDTSGDWAGQYASHENVINDTFSASITDDNGVLSGTLTVPMIGLSDAPLTGTVEANIISFGDIDGLITFVGVVTNGGVDAYGSYIYANGFEDKGTWQASRQ